MTLWIIYQLLFLWLLFFFLAKLFWWLFDSICFWATFNLNTYRSVSEIVQARSVGSKSVPQLFTCRENHALCKLFTSFLSNFTTYPSASYVVKYGLLELCIDKCVCESIFQVILSFVNFVDACSIGMHGIWLLKFAFLSYQV